LHLRLGRVVGPMLKLLVTEALRQEAFDGPAEHFGLRVAK
jgi:hypothetical protein